MRFKLFVLAVFAILASADRASAQVMLPPGSSDTVSPYLNLLQNPYGVQSGNAPTYQTLVRPQIEARNAINQNRNGIQQLQGQLNNGRRASGNNTHFLNYSHYYIGIQR